MYCTAFRRRRNERAVWIWNWRLSDLSRSQGEVMRVKKVTNSEHGPRHVTPAGRSVFYDLFPAEKAAELEMRARLLKRLERWLEKSLMTQAETAKVLGVTQARVLRYCRSQRGGLPTINPGCANAVMDFP